MCVSGVHAFSAAGLQKVKESFLPFWAVTAKVDVHLMGASLGYDSWQPVYNPATRYCLLAVHVNGLVGKRKGQQLQ